MRRYRRPGFSLLELVVVLAIMTAVSAIGILRYSNSLSNYRVEAACARFIADLRVAQTQARTTSSNRTVRFSAAQATYQVFTSAELATNSPGTAVSLADDPYRVSMRIFGLPGDSISFNGRGEGNGGAIFVFASGHVEKAVTLEPGYGRAYVAGSGE